MSSTRIGPPSPPVLPRTAAPADTGVAAARRPQASAADVTSSSTDLGDDTARHARDERAAAFLTHANAARQTEAERKAVALASVPGQVAAPALVLNPTDLLAQVQDGVLTVRVPLNAGQKIGSARVRPDTTAVVRLVARDGKIDREHTCIELEHADGSRTDLDGPLWVDADRVYINADGQIRADVPCFPNPNITKEIVGNDADRIPESVDGLVRALASRGALPGGMQMTTGFSSDLAPDALRAAIAGTESGRPAVPRGATAATATPAEGLRAALDLAGLQIDFEGTLKSGPICFGEGTMLNVADGAQVRCGGALANLHVEVNAPVRSLQLTAEGTRLRSGSGRVAASIDFSPERGTAIAFRELEVSGVECETPAGTRKHRLSLRNLSVRGRESDEPCLSYRGARGDQPAHMALRLPELDLQGVSGALQLEGSDGKPAELRLGENRLGRGHTRPLNVRASLELDSATGFFNFDSQVEDFIGTVTPLALVDSDGFDLDLGAGELTGAGRVAVRREEGRSRVRLEAAAGRRWNLSAAVADAQLGGPAAGASVFLDLAPASQGRLSLERLELGTGETPRFHGDAEIDVVLDDLNLTLPGGNRVQLDRSPAGEARPSGTLVIRDMAWAAGDRSPTIDAVLRLNLGANAMLQPGAVPGLEGARVVVDAKTGKTVLELEAKVDRDGHVECAAGLRLQSFEVRTQLARGMTALPEPEIAAEPLHADAPMALARVRALVPPPARPLVAPAEATIPALPPVSLSPISIFGALARSDLRFSVPADAFNVRVFDRGFNQTTDFGIVSDRAGWAATVDLQRAAGPIAAKLVIARGRVDARASRLEVDPPLIATLHGQVWLPGPGAPSHTAMLTVRGLSIVEEEGKARIVPDMDISSSFVGAADSVVPGDLQQHIREAIGDELAKALFGTSRLPLDAASLTALLASRYPSIGRDIEIQPRLAGTAGSQTPASSPATPRASGLASADAAPSHATAPPPGGPAEQLLGHLHLGSARLDVTDARFTATRIDLGAGQHLELLPGSNLAVSGTPQDFTISGRALLGSMQLGGPELAASITRGEADVCVRVQARPGGEPQVTVELSNLTGSGVAVDGKVGDGRTRLSGCEVSGGHIRFATGGGQSAQLDVDLPRVQGRIEAEGAASLDSTQGSAGLLRGDIRGSLRYAGGALSGRLDDVRLIAEELSLAGSGTNAGASLRLAGAATIRYDRDGTLSLGRLGDRGLQVDGDMALPDGSRFGIQDGRAERITVNLGSRPLVTIEGMTAGFSCLTPVATGPGGEPGVVADVRRAHGTGSLQFGPGGMRTLGPVSLTGVDASFTGLSVVPDGRSRLDLPQIDISGDGKLEISPERGWVFTPGTRMVDGAARSTVRARAVAREIRFVTKSPHVDVDLAEGAQGEFDLNGLAVGGPFGLSVDLRRGSFSGVVEAGTAAVGTPGSALSEVEIQPGTLVAAEIARIATGVFAGAQSNATSVDVTMRLEGHMGEHSRDIHDPAVTLETIDVGGAFRMILRAVTDGDGNFTARSHTILDAEARVRMSAEVDPRAAWHRLGTASGDAPR